MILGKGQVLLNEIQDFQSQKMFQDPKKYNDNAKLQQLIAKQLVELSKENIKRASTMLDIGCGTGFVGIEALKINPNLEITGIDISREMCLESKKHYRSVIEGDIKTFLPDKPYDIILSSMCFQWITDEIPLFSIKENLFFAVPIHGSLAEISFCFEKANIPCPILDFENRFENRYKTQPFYVKEYKETYKSLLSALKAFNLIGARNDSYQIPIKPSSFKILEKYFTGVTTWKIGFFNK